MKATRDDAKFNPVIVTLESQDEVDLIYELLHAVAFHVSHKAYNVSSEVRSVLSKYASDPQFLYSDELLLDPESHIATQN
jgi:hypothetical protein